ncbi:MAG: hypothetical protein QMD13_06865 [Candidatus Bathyarchaeia archaeon]|nr:hypothetical protein [Candidatus Bathyarchaeia archaeon]
MNFRITKSKTISVMLLLGFLLYPSTILFNLTYAFPERSWTFMVYLDADNNLEAAGINDLNEMEIVGSSETLAIIVQIDRILGYDSSNGNWAETRRYYVTKDNNVETINSNMLENMGELNMGNPETPLIICYMDYRKLPS